jgi:hypothetical protein
MTAPHQIENQNQSVGTSLLAFAQAITTARRAFEANPGITTEWLAYYEAKQTAYEKLADSVPRIKEIEDFWRYIQSMSATAWLPLIERELERISGHHCRNCPTLIPTTRQLCDSCKKAARAETLRKAQQRKREENKRPRCPECGINPIYPEQRKCDACKREARKDRNRRHRESLKESKVRRVEADFTQESLVNTSRKRISVGVGQTVDMKASY